MFAVVVVLTLAFGGLYAWGASELFQDVSGFGGNEFGLDARTLAGATLLGLAMFGTLFLGAVLAVFLTLSARPRRRRDAGCCSRSSSARSAAASTWPGASWPPRRSPSPTSPSSTRAPSSSPA